MGEHPPGRVSAASQPVFGNSKCSKPKGPRQQGPGRTCDTHVSRVAGEGEHGGHLARDDMVYANRDALPDHRCFAVVSQMASPADPARCAWSGLALHSHAPRKRLACLPRQGPLERSVSASVCFIQLTSAMRPNSSANKNASVQATARELLQPLPITPERGSR